MRAARIDSATVGPNGAVASANDIIRLESDAANLHALYKNGSAISGPGGTDSAGSANTGQGIRGGSNGGPAFANSFEAGVLGETTAAILAGGLGGLGTGRTRAMRGASVGSLG